MSKTHKKYSRYMEDQRVFFDELVTNDWDEYSNKLWDIERNWEIKRLFKRIKPKSVLNIGCGSGFHDVLIAENFFVANVIGIDYSKESLRKAEKHYSHPKVKRYVSSYQEFGLTNFDLIVSFQVIEHLTDAKEFLEICKKLCKKGGVIAVFTPNRMRLTNRMRKLLKLPLNLEDVQHFQEFTTQELKTLGLGIGLVTIDEFAYNLSFEVPKFGWQIIPRRLSRPLGSLFPRIANRVAVIFQN